MYTCSFNHEEIVHEYRICPLCSAIDDISELQKCLESITAQYETTIEERDEFYQLLKDHHPELLI